MGLTLFDVDVTSLCRFSDCRRYRYWLDRVWDEDLPRIAWILLNPSTADEKTNDPTIERVMRRSRSLGYGGFVVVNLFALRSTDPAALRCDHPISEVGNPKRNDRNIVEAAIGCDKVVAGWGVHGSHLGRDAAVVDLVRRDRLWCLGKTKEGHPRHPLYVPYSKDLERF